MSWEYDFPDGFEEWSDEEKSAWFTKQRNLKQAERMTKVIPDHGRDWVDVMKEQKDKLQSYLEVSKIDDLF